MKNNTNVETWTLEDLMDSLQSIPEKKKKIEIPTYQRNLVWKKKQKKLLIDSIKNGMPMGAILLYNAGSENNINRYTLIDGLQRTKAIKDYNLNPTAYFDKDCIDKTMLKSLSNEYEIDIEEVESLFLKWVHSRKGFDEVNEFSSSNFIYYLEEKITNKTYINDVQKHKKLTSNLLPKYLQQIKKDSFINDSKIPVIIYSGDQSNLPNIFERINSKGTQLNKYQIYAATWVKYKKIKIENKQIINKIKDKYDTIVNNDLEVENYDPINFEKSNFNYFEYFFGLGKLLTDSYPFLFKKNSNIDQTESIGFNLGSLCLKNDLKQMSTLPVYLEKIDINNFEKALIDSVNITNQILIPFIGFKANKKNKEKPKVPHSEMQISSIIAKIFLTCYNDEFLKSSRL